jgi:uncharacterized protein (DUF58 family)
MCFEYAIGVSPYFFRMMDHSAQSHPGLKVVSLLANPLFRWLKPQDFARVSNLQWIARDVVDGLSGGIHRSRHIGASVDFKEHRPYVAGDEIRSIDWKLFGKTDRLYIRQFEDETNLRATIVVDQSGSMKYSGSRSSGLTKHEYAVRLAACLAYLLISQQDSVGMVTFDTTIRTNIPARSRPNHLRALMQTLSDSECRGETDLGSVLHELLGICKKRGLVILISDCFGDIPSLLRSLTLLRSNHQEVVVIQVVDDDETDFPFSNRTLFRSLETSDHQVLVDPVSLRRTYLDNWERFQRELKEGCQQKRIDLLSMTSSKSFSEVVASYVAQRGYA